LSVDEPVKMISRLRSVPCFRFFAIFSALTCAVLLSGCTSQGGLNELLTGRVQTGQDFPPLVGSEQVNEAALKSPQEQQQLRDQLQQQAADLTARRNKLQSSEGPRTSLQPDQQHRSVARAIENRSGAGRKSLQ
jgi:hypothetical protein